MEQRVHPDLKDVFSSLTDMILSEETLNDIRNKGKQAIVSYKNEYLLLEEQWIPGLKDTPKVSVKIYRPKKQETMLPGVLYIHGGGYIFGSVEGNDAKCGEIIEAVNCVVVSVDYRLAPEHPYPAAIEDCYAALTWFSQNASSLNVDVDRIAVVGGSTGGGLTAALSLMARDRKGPKIKFQMPLFPMIDDRCNSESCNEITDKRVWCKEFNMFAWKMYLKNVTGDIPMYAAPARVKDYSNLPPTYSAVGELDPFRDETIKYVMNLTNAGVPVEFHLYPGCFHEFEAIEPKASISQLATKETYRALKEALYN
ncbi:alpha/beta hydrolase [Neobacillus ginsengisoli]|uniref:Acetyl esterase/lipase n=1 Tax=Neobacillus ginsengisoli TaxID=904295 RepID=A0ABT9Y2M9_9BACI|nr:alpha/beta hydrolase [Neobacillus ginsengisoli]MDQ0202071.1 acetyl esterase/lipase [Neobacillus ginsengisoli]